MMCSQILKALVIYFRTVHFLFSDLFNKSVCVCVRVRVCVCVCVCVESGPGLETIGITKNMQSVIVYFSNCEEVICY